MTVDSLRTMYDSEEFFEGGEQNVNYYSFLSGETYLRRTAKGRIERFRPQVRGTRLLEVASAAGFFLAEGEAAGFKAAGVEYQPDGCLRRETGRRCRSPPAPSRRSS